MPKGNISGTDQEMLVITMSKLGGGELNVSSDVDLIFCYSEDGEISRNILFPTTIFCLLVRKLISRLNDITAYGYVFRVDMRLHPYGENSHLVMICHAGRISCYSGARSAMPGSKVEY